MSQSSIPRVIAARQRGPDNLRATVRYRCAPATIGRVYVGEDHEFQHAWVVNLSREGAGFVLARPLPMGLAVLIQIRGNETAVAHELTALVVHCTAHPPDEWMAGCEFAQPLSPELLDDLL